MSFGKAAASFGEDRPIRNALEATDKSPLSMELDRLNSAIHQLEGALGRLGNKLEPIRVSRPSPEQEPDNAPSPPRSPTVGTIMGFRSRVESLAELAEMLRSEVEC